MEHINDFNKTAYEIEKSLANPISKQHIDKWIIPGDSILVVIPDITRKCPIPEILCVLIPIVKSSNPYEIILLVANGNHRKMTEEELKSHVGEDIYKNYLVINHDSTKDTTYIGTTSYGNKVKINSIAVNADKVFLIGSANYHTFAGFSGGRKSILPGIASRETILYNHRLMMTESGITLMLWLALLIKTICSLICVKLWSCSEKRKYI
jgi:nickel-dependent lactate racemase